MKKPFIYMLSLLALVVMSAYLGCGDGRYGTRPLWGSMSGTGTNSNITVIALECVDVIDYKNIEHAAVSPEEVTETEDTDLTEGEVTTQLELNPKVLPAVRTIRLINKIDINKLDFDISKDDVEESDEESEVSDEDFNSPALDADDGDEDTDTQGEDIEPVSEEDIQRCVEREIRDLKRCGPSCKIYWGNRTWLLTRERTFKKPKQSEVKIVGFEGCEQVEQAECLLID